MKKQESDVKEDDMEMNLMNEPFNLSREDIAWVESTLASMSIEEKIGQIFCVTDVITDAEELKAFILNYSRHCASGI